MNSDKRDNDSRLPLLPDLPAPYPGSRAPLKYNGRPRPRGTQSLEVQKLVKQAALDTSARPLYDSNVCSILVEPCGLGAFSAGMISIGVLMMVGIIPTSTLERNSLWTVHSLGMIASILLVVVGVLSPWVCLQCCLCYRKPADSVFEHSRFYGYAALHQNMQGATIRQHYSVAGKDNASRGTVVLLPGAGAPRGTMLPLARRLARNFRVIALDLPGHGTLSTVPYTLQHCSTVIARVLAREGVSMGRGPGSVRSRVGRPRDRKRDRDNGRTRGGSAALSPSRDRSRDRSRSRGFGHGAGSTRGSMAASERSGKRDGFVSTGGGRPTAGSGSGAASLRSGVSALYSDGRQRGASSSRQGAGTRGGASASHSRRLDPGRRTDGDEEEEDEDPPVVLVSQGAALFAAAVFALRHQDTVGGVVSMGPVPDYTGGRWCSCGHWEQYFLLRWVAWCANRDILSAVESSDLPAEERQQAASRDFQLHTVPAMIDELQGRPVLQDLRDFRGPLLFLGPKDWVAQVPDMLPYGVVQTRRLKGARRQKIPPLEARRLEEAAVEVSAFAEDVFAHGALLGALAGGRGALLGRDRRRSSGYGDTASLRSYRRRRPADGDGGGDGMAEGKNSSSQAGSVAGNGAGYGQGRGSGTESDIELGRRRGTGTSYSASAGAGAGAPVAAAAVRVPADRRRLPHGAATSSDFGSASDRGSFAAGASLPMGTPLLDGLLSLASPQHQSRGPAGEGAREGRPGSRTYRGNSGSDPPVDSALQGGYRRGRGEGASRGRDRGMGRDGTRRGSAGGPSSQSSRGGARAAATGRGDAGSGGRLGRVSRQDSATLAVDSLFGSAGLSELQREASDGDGGGEGEGGSGGGGARVGGHLSAGASMVPGGSMASSAVEGSSTHPRAQAPSQGIPSPSAASSGRRARAGMAARAHQASIRTNYRYRLVSGASGELGVNGGEDDRSRTLQNGGGSPGGAGGGYQGGATEEASGGTGSRVAVQPQWSVLRDGRGPSYGSFDGEQERGRDWSYDLE